MNRKYYVYQLIDSRDNKVFYIGKGQKMRMYEHVKNVQRGRIPNGTNIKLCNKIKKILSFKLNVKYKKILITENEQEAFDKEKEIISKIGLKNLCNLTNGGEGGSSKGRKLSEEHKRKISESHKGIKPTEKTRKKLKKPKTAEHKIKISRTMIKNKISLGKSNPMYGKSIYDTWIEKYGKEIDDIKMKEYKEIHRKIHSGNNNPMYGKSVYNIWVEKYEEEAKRRKKIANEKRSKTLKKRYESD